ncbi:hypothetical protein Esti_001835 [Eimeria stiedai]
MLESAVVKGDMAVTMLEVEVHGIKEDWRGNRVEDEGEANASSFDASLLVPPQGKRDDCVSARGGDGRQHHCTERRSSRTFSASGDALGGFLQIPPSAASSVVAFHSDVAPLQRRGVSSRVLFQVVGLLAAAAAFFLIGLCVRRFMGGKAGGFSRRLAGKNGTGGDICEGASGTPETEEPGPSREPDDNPDQEGGDGPGPVTQARQAFAASEAALTAYRQLIMEAIQELGNETHPNLAITPTGRMLKSLVCALMQHLGTHKQALASHTPFLSPQEAQAWQQAVGQAEEAAESARSAACLAWYDGQPPEQELPVNVRILLLLQSKDMTLRRNLEAFLCGYPERWGQHEADLSESNAEANTALQQMMLHGQALAADSLVNRKAREKAQKLKELLRSVLSVFQCYRIKLPGQGHFPGTDALLIRAVEGYAEAVEVVLSFFFDGGSRVDINVLAAWGSKLKSLHRELERRLLALRVRPHSMYAHDQGAAREAVEKARRILAVYQDIVDSQGTVVD